MFQKGHKPYYDNGCKVRYNDKDYDSIASLCRELDVDLSSFRFFVYYKYKKYSGKVKKNKIIRFIQRDMDEYLKKHAKITIGGVEYDSFADCCRKNGVNYGTIYNRIKRKNCSKDKIFSKKRIGRIKDHLGNDYSSISAMCKVYGVSKDVYKQRIEAGESIKRALTGKTHKRKIDKGKKTLA